MRRCNPALRYGLCRTSPRQSRRPPAASASGASTWRRRSPPTRPPRTIRPAVRRPPRPDRCVHWRHGRPRRAPSRWRICGPKRKSPRRTAERKPPNVPRGWRPAGRSCRAPPPATHRPRGGAVRRPAARIARCSASSATGRVQSTCARSSPRSTTSVGAATYPVSPTTSACPRLPRITT